MTRQEEGRDPADGVEKREEKGGYGSIRSPEKVRALERRFTREHISALSYDEALDLFESMWREARALNPDFPGDWRESVASRIEIARTLNALGSGS